MMSQNRNLRNRNLSLLISLPINRKSNKKAMALQVKAVSVGCQLKSLRLALRIWMRIIRKIDSNKKISHNKKEKSPSADKNWTWQKPNREKYSENVFLMESKVHCAWNLT